ncbi:hypothetical protein BI308_26000 [Roseofilum reptotaenium AO1-A]|uniref:Uncharacterized protein n=1 Tax=Roseofilum reptotaenium AO1-A TaxID=1925591 RepID=A0A1L9QAB1_9CYAN|nr:hypothetical protein BI308_26000 [Roseofilum reptotaenium AO1-A]
MARKKRGRFSALRKQARGNRGQLPTGNSDLANYAKWYFGDETMIMSPRPEYRITGIARQLVKVPLLPFNKAMPKDEPEGAGANTVSASYYVIGTVTNFSHQLITMCCNTANIFAQLGWKEPSAAAGGVKERIEGDPTYLPAALTPTYRQANDEGQEKTSRITGKKYKTFKQRSATVPFGRMHLATGSPGYTSANNSEEDRKTALITSLQNAETNYRCENVGYEAEEFLIVSADNAPWVVNGTPNIEASAITF